MDKKTGNINVHLTDAEERSTRIVADVYGISASEWCRIVILRELRKERDKASLMHSAFFAHGSEGSLSSLDGDLTL